MVDKARNLSWTKFGRYALLEKIGAGGMAEIYRAKTFGAAGFEKEFAIKLILPSLVDDTEFVEMFVNEAKIAVSLYHANVVQVFDLGEIDSQYYIAMEFVHGKDLLDVLARCAHLDLKIPLDIVLFITMEMLKGLDFAHRAKNAYGEDLNIIHRDVSPSNVLMSYAGDVKLGDFGVAKAAIQRGRTETGTLKGKVGYMSPEQVVGEDIDYRSDIFSAGIVFFEALSMSRLFVGNSDLDVMLRVRDADIEPSLRKSGPLPSPLDLIIRKALAKHREERYQSAGEFYQALVDFCYQYRIKVNGSDLSHFMRRLFAEEIEAEKERRRHDMEVDGKVFAESESHPRQRPSFVTPRPPQPAELPSESEVVADAQSDENGTSPDEAEETASRFRYKDHAGLIFGPMSEDTIVQLLNEKSVHLDDRVSIDGGPWEPPGDFATLRPHVQVPTEAMVDASKSNPLGAGVYKRKEKKADPVPTKLKDIEDAAHALEEISFATSSTAAEFVDSASETELGAGSSPVISSPPVAEGPRTAEEAQRVIKNLREQYASYEGSLLDVSFARLLTRLHRTKATGRLYVHEDIVEKSIFFEKGEPVLVDSNKESELLGFFLLSRNIISQEQLEGGLARLSEWGGRLGDALVAIGAIPAHEIFHHLSEQMKEKLLDVFTWKSGYYGYFENQQPDTHGYPLGIDAYQTIVEGCLSRMPIARIRSFYGERRNMSMHMRSDAEITIENLRLSSKALRIVKTYNPGDSLAVLLQKLSDEDRDYVYRVVYLLHQVELFTFEVTGDNQELPG